jgi:hypothetical protein
MKEGGSTKEVSFLCLGAQQEKSKVLVIFFFFFLLWEMCALVFLSKLQYLVALEGRMPKGVHDCIFEG